MRQKVCSLLIASLLGAAAAYATGAAKNVCIKSDDGGGELRINLETGEYELCLADHRSFGGKLSRDPVNEVLRETFPGGEVAMFPPTTRLASVTVKLGAEIINLFDKDIGDNDCSCQTPASFGSVHEVLADTPTEVAVAQLRDAARTLVCHNNLKQIGLALHDNETARVVRETVLAPGEFFSLDLEAVNGGAVASGVDQNHQLRLWWINSGLDAGPPVFVGPRNTLAADIAPYGPDSIMLVRTDFSGRAHREIRSTPWFVVQQSLPGFDGVGTAWDGGIQPTLAGNGAQGNVLVKNPQGSSWLFVICSQNGVDRPPIPLDPEPEVPSLEQVFDPDLRYNPASDTYHWALGVGDRLVQYDIDCETGTAGPPREGLFAVPDRPFAFNGQGILPMAHGGVGVGHCHLDQDTGDGRLLLEFLGDPPHMVVGPACEGGAIALDQEAWDEAMGEPQAHSHLYFAGNSLDHVEVHLAPPDPPAGPWLTSGELPGFEVKARITAGSASIAGRKEADCIAETLCISGAVAGRPEIFARAPGPKPNGHLWPTLAKFSTSRVEVWMRQPRTGTLRYYLLEEVAPGEQLLDLAGLAHKTGFLPPFDAAASSAGAAATTSSEAAALAPLAGPLAGTSQAALAFLAVDLAAASSFAVAAAPAAGDPPPPAGPWLTASGLPGFRAKVRISDSLDGRKENDCIAETLCVSGAVAGRPEVFVRVVGPKPNGYLWPTLVKFSTSRVEVWIEQTSTGVLRYYDLPAVAAGEDLLELAGVADKLGFSG